MTPEEAQNLIESTGNQSITYLGSRKSMMGVEENVTLDDDKRRTHVLNVGPTGHGKTQLLLHVALQDARKGRGLCIINPKGEMIDEFLAKLPEDRVEDVVYVNPAQEPVTPINVLEPHITDDMNTAQRENQKEIIVSDLIDLFKRQSENWGDQFGRVLETLLRAHLDQNIKHDESKTLVDVFRCVINEDELSDLVDRIQDSVIREQLVRVKEDMSSYDLEPLQRRLNDFVMNATIRRVIGAEDSGVDFKEVVDEGKILLVDIRKSDIGETTSELVGSIAITKIWAAAQSRIAEPEDQRTPFYLYVDELQNFGGEGSNFTKMLSEAREYRLGCWLATQYLHQLATEMRRAVSNNCRTKVFFDPSGTEDINRIAGMLHGLDRDTLTSMGKYRAAVQKPAERTQQNAITFDTYPPWNADYSDVEQIKRQSSADRASRTELQIEQSLGNQANAGSKKHQELLAQAEKQLEERGFQTHLFHQGHEEEKPDGHVHLPDGELAHLEAECQTLSKPAKVLKNLRRGLEEEREVLFVVEEGNAAKLENIVSDPVNRRGSEYEDENGSYSYYTDDGESVTDVEVLKQVEYRILELSGEELQERQKTEMECPELEYSTREDLEVACLYRNEDDFCTELGTKCVLLEL
ncbi:type IV secretory system conjugative DNA transfer family protein [Haloplanus aerogenes]|uniref:Type IV secretion system coupling TraD/TrwB family protein n=1 Tax=Haloplanus aerogenes TaxID=660522 RepID=A0A3M0CU08_9EURY|nr:type IV secretion system DNA-binding domain-containing protein [Haloplanus aerogenes]AZH26683.1 type IV secretory system conjugative DNA transfer family protein [Haloplanus aerogenes]RMB12921.1 type IV secretion system coupling TraD/TrwB family protein [Haloplanus aerogenes]